MLYMKILLKSFQQAVNYIVQSNSNKHDFSFIFPANVYLLKVNNRNTRKRCEICSKLTIKTLERRQFLLMTLNK